MFVFTISYLPSRIISINYLNQCVRFELVVSDKLSQDQFKSFGQNLKLNLEYKVQNNPFLIVLLMDFNSKSSNWCENDTTASEGKAIEKISSQFGLHEVINEPTNILESSSCFDLIFTSQPNLITESRVHSSLYPTSHHQIIFAKFNQEIFFLPPYFHNVWHCQDANTDHIR